MDYDSFSERDNEEEDEDEGSATQAHTTDNKGRMNMMELDGEGSDYGSNQGDETLI